MVKIPQRALPELPPEKMSAFSYVPLGFRPIDGPSMVPTYPTGLPLLFAAASVITGWDAAPHWTIGIHTLLGVLLVFGLGRQCGLSPEVAALGALIVGMSPLYLLFGLQAMTDVPALVWVTGAVMLAWHSRTRPGLLMPLAAGAVFAMAVLVRPTNVIAIIPILFAFGIQWRRLLLFGLGGLPGAVFLALYNRAAYGSMFEQGYVGIPGLMRGEWVGITLAHYAVWLPVLLTPLVVLALGVPWLLRTTPRPTIVLAAWIGGFAGFYAFYYFTHEVWWSLRFVLPAFPPLVVAALLVLQRLTARVNRPMSRWIAGGVATVSVLIWSLAWAAHFHVLSTGQGEAAYRESAVWARENLPENAVVVTMQTSGAVIYYTDFVILRWDELTPEIAAAVNSNLEASNRPLFAVLFPYEVKEVVEKHLLGDWKEFGAVSHVTIWRRESAEMASEN
jgi:hypothetical protein